MIDIKENLRRILPESVRRVLRGKYNSIWYRFIADPWERLQLLVYRIGGGSYIAWYARRLDRYATKSGAELAKTRHMQSGQDDLAATVAAGLQPHHYLYEFGMGHGRAAQHFIRYLEPGHYYGNDASAGRVAQCQSYLELRDLTQKLPQLFATDSNDFSWLKDGRRFDYFWCSAVLSHMPDADVKEVFVNLRMILAPSGIALISDAYLDGSSDVTRYTAKDWFRPPSWYISLAESVGYRADDLTEDLPRGNPSFAERRVIGADPNYTLSSHLIRLTLPTT